MKIINQVILLLFAVTSSYGQKLVTYSVDPTNSVVRWTGYAQAGTYAPHGTIKIKSARFTMDGARLTSAKIVMNMTTIDHDNKQLQEHLRGEDFFDCAKFPEAEFDLLAFNGNTVTGNLTIKGITKQISFPVMIANQNNIITVKADVKIDRTVFNIKYKSASFFQDLGSYAIKNEFDLNIDLVANSL
ncbi:MAG: YceI family protein [Mucilaginibacter sp.]